jgi:hypothetical protein
LDFPGTIYSASTWIVPILIAITFHEAAHAYAAWKLGDDTAHRLGRVTFNPLKHVDLFGTILLPALLFLTKAPFLFGWAKPVPVAFGRLGHPRRDMAIVAIAGPVTNVMLAFVSAGLLRIVWVVPEAMAPWLVQTLYQSILLNLILGNLQHASAAAPGRRSRCLSILPKGPGKAIRKAGAVRLPDSARDHLPSADAWQADRNRPKPLPLGCWYSAAMADSDLPGNSRGGSVASAECGRFK